MAYDHGRCNFVRRWIRGIAERSYEITIDRSRVTIRITSGASITTHEYKISDIRDVRSTAVVSSGKARKNGRKLFASNSSSNPASRWRFSTEDRPKKASGC